MDICSVLLLESLCRVTLWDLMVTWVNVLCGQSSHIDSQHSLPYFSGWPICSQWLSCSSGNLVASLFQTAKIFVVCLISTIIFLLPVNPGLVWIPSYALSILFIFLANPKGFDSFSPGKCNCAAFCTHWRALSKYDAWRIQKLQKDRMLSNRVP